MSAKILDKKKIYHADRCSPLSEAVKKCSVELNALARNGYPGKKMPKDFLKGVCTIGCWNIPKNQDWGLGWHRNEGLEITFLDSGSIHFSTDTSALNLKAGKVTITQPWQRHKLGNPNISANKLFWLILDLQVLKPNDNWKWPSWICLENSEIKSFEKLLSSTKNHVRDSDKNMQNCWRDIEEYIKSYKPQTSSSLLAIKINELIFHTIKTLKKHNTKEFINPSLYTVDLFLAELKSSPELAAKKWNIENMARRCGVNQTSFFNFCKKLTNKTPVNYLNFLRINTSKELIKNGCKITEAALECGFETSQYFSTVFTNLEGFSPREFKNSLLKK